MSKKKKSKVKILVFAVEVIVLLLVLVGLFVSSKFAKLDNNHEEEIKKADKNELSEETQKVLKEYTTVAIFGLDNRSNGKFEQGNSDVIMIASINEKTKEVKVLSVYRDTYLDITNNDGYKKANAAFAYGGAEQAVSMLNVNLDLSIDEYVVIDFNAVADAVDILGGVEIELNGVEAALMPDLIDEVARVTGKTANQNIWSAGVYNLDGVQATAYARIRKTAGNDFRRTQRQRLVLEKMMEKMMSSDLSTVNKLADTVLENVKTSFTNTEILGRVKDVLKYKLGEMAGFPFDKTTADFEKGGDCVIAVDLATNVAKLHEFLYNKSGYQVTSTVQTISENIVNDSGIALGAPTIKDE